MFSIAEGDWTVVLGDVLGKGPEAATVTALTRYTARASALTERRPSAVLGVVNQALRRHESHRFCTASYVRFQLDARGDYVATFASAGHPPCLLWRADGSVAPVEVTGRLLGVFDEWQGDEHSMALEAGDTLLLYSDGLPEARRGSELFGDDRLFARFAELGDQPVEAILDRLLADVDGFCEDGPQDDIALLAVRVGPPAH